MTNIEQEYNDYIRNKWHELSDATKDILKFRHQHEQKYIDMMAQWSIEFMQDKLKSLEAKKT